MTTDTKPVARTKIKVALPKRWNVIIINDEVTPFDFVISILVEVFRHTEEDANVVTLQVHEVGAAVAGSYDFEIAEVKAVEATKIARENGFPLQIKIESDE
jgi:ATP-dependent Clp protease adaptor protein ClpS